MPRKVFTAGEILTAANLNDVSDATVMVFDDATARTTAIPTPVEGMVTYLKDEDEVTVFDGSAFKAVGPGKILQVVSTTLTSVFSESVGPSGISGNVTGLTPSITPSSTDNDVLVTASISTDGDHTNSVTLFRDGTAIAIGDAAGNRRRATSPAVSSSFNGASVCINFLDSPATTSSVTYSVRLGNDSSLTETLAVNRSGADENLGRRARHVSTITLQEVAG